MTAISPDLPAQFVSRIKVDLGGEAFAFFESLASKAPTSLRLNPDKLIKEPAGTSAIPWCPHGRILEKRPSFTADPAFHAGAYYVQEASSMFLWHVLEQLGYDTNPVTACDLSAAPGGKTTLLNSALLPESIIVANEPIAARNKILRQNLTRWGTENVLVTQNDPTDFSGLPEFFDLLLVDAPCSGEGLFRKDPVAVREWSPQHLEHCARRQRRILKDALPSLKSGGHLIYSTCTYNPGENEENMGWLLESEELEIQHIEVPESWNVRQGDAAKPGYSFFPHRVEGEGFFIAILKKAGEKRKDRIPRFKSKRPSREAGKSTVLDQEWLNTPDHYLFLNRQDHRIAMPKHLYPYYEHVRKALKITSSGLNMGKAYHGKLRPAPELALSTALRPDFPSVEMTRQEALAYLSHASLPNWDIPPGWYVGKYAGLGLGFLKVLPNGRINNNYPTAWRILNLDRIT